MAYLSLRISVPEKNLIKMMQFDPNAMVYDVCNTVREKVSEINGKLDQGKVSFSYINFLYHF